MKTAKSYIMEHVKGSILDDDELIFEIQCNNRYPDLIRVQFQSRHSRSVKYNATVRFNSLREQPIQGWCCSCLTGPRKLGCCSHVAALLWHLGVNQGRGPESHPLSTSHLLKYVEDSTIYTNADESEDDDNDVLYTAHSANEI